MASEQMLEKVDILRKRFNLTYKEAYELLERKEGNVVKACIAAESEQQANKGISALMPDLLEKVEERATVLGKDLLAKMQEIVKTGQSSNIRVVRDGRTVLTIPTAVGAAVAMVFPYLTVITTVAAMTQRFELVWDRRRCSTDPDNPHQPGLTNVHDEAKVEYVEINPSVSSGKIGSV